MATFQAQVEALTGQSIGSGSAPTTGQLSQYLKDAVIEVTNRVITLNPMESVLFQTESSEQTANNSYTVKGKVITVVRENGTDGRWEKCYPVPNDMEWRVQDIESLEYATKYSPVYLIRDNGKMSVYPSPGSSNDGFKVYYISNDPKRDSDAAVLAHDSEDIRNFPKERVYLVVLNAACKSIQTELAKINLPDDLNIPVMDTVSTSLPIYTEPSSFVMPVVPPNMDVDFSRVVDAVDFVPPVYSPPVFPTINAMNLPSAPIAPSISVSVVSEGGMTNPTYVAPVMNVPDWGDTNNWISVEEDPEMLNARVTEIDSKIKEYTTKLQNSVAVFNKESEILKKDLQVAMTNASLSDENQKKEIQIYQSNISKYQQEVNSEQQRWMAEEYTPKYSEWEREFELGLQEYAANINKETARVKASLDEMNSEIQRALSSYEAETGYKTARFQTEIEGNIKNFEANLAKNSTDFTNNLQKYQTEFQKVVADNQNKVSLFSAEVQDYTARIQKFRTDYEWMQTRYLLLKKEYDDAFMVMGAQNKQQGER